MTLDLAQAVPAALAAGAVVFAYLLGKTVGADEERSRIARSRRNVERSRKAS